MAVAGRSPSGQPRLVILRALGLGDLLTAVPALRALARAFPDHERVLAAPAALAPLVELIDAGVARGSATDGVASDRPATDGVASDRPAIDRLLDVAEMAPLPPALHGADVAVNLHGSGPQSHRIVLEAAPARPLWFAHPDVPASAGAPRWRFDEHEVARWCRMLEHYGIGADPTELRLRPPPAGAAPGADGATLIHPGAASPARRWPPERFAAVARAERDRGRRVLLTGSEAERTLAEQLARAAGLPESAVVAGQTDLAGLASAVSRAGRVVCGDTGVAHLATAFGTPSVVLFGPMPPALWGPPPGQPQHSVLWAGRTGDPHGQSPDPGLLQITVAAVLEALGRLPEPAAEAVRAR